MTEGQVQVQVRVHLGHELAEAIHVLLLLRYCIPCFGRLGVQPIAALPNLCSINLCRT
jgi:hypothetical protein